MSKDNNDKLGSLEDVDLNDNHRNVLDIPEVRKKVEGLEIEKDGKDYVVETRETAYIGKDAITKTEPFRKADAETTKLAGLNIQKDWDSKSYLWMTIEGSKKANFWGFKDYLARYSEGLMKTSEIPDHPGLKHYFKEYKRSHDNFCKYNIKPEVDYDKGISLWLNKILLNNKAKRKLGLEDNAKMILDLADEAIIKYLAGEIEIYT